jgi:hypothetical protein
MSEGNAGVFMSRLPAKASHALLARFVALMFVLAARPGWAQAQDTSLPAYTALRCESACGKWTRAKLIDKPTSFPSGEVGRLPQYDAEALVRIRFTVTAEGKVENPVVERLVGPQNFAEQSVNDVKGWRYEPATMNGVPIAQLNSEVELLYTFNPPELGARSSVYSALQNGRRFIEDQKFADSEAVLLPILALPRLNFYERAMASYFLAIAEASLNHLAAAGDYMDNALIGDGQHLSASTRERAIRLKIRIDAATGHYADALRWFAVLTKDQTLDPGDPDAKVITDVRARLATANSIGVTAKIPSAELSEPWHYNLVRRNFSFTRIDGKLDNFELRCDQQQLRSAVSDKAEWHVPKDWSNCSLDVFGAAGAEFQLVELTD